MGFVVEQDMVCGNNKVPANLRITVPIPPTIKALNACVSLKFGVHANYPECHPAACAPTAAAPRCPTPAPTT